MQQPGNLQNSSEEELIRACISPETREAAFFEIVRRYKERIYYHCRKLTVNHDDADDAAQNTFIRVWENLGNFRQESRLFSWIYRIATNESLTVLRKRKPSMTLDDAMPELADLQAQADMVSGDGIERKLQNALATLPFKQKLVFVLRYQEEMSYEDISEVTGTSVGALKASYFYAVRKIEEILGRSV